MWVQNELFIYLRPAYRSMQLFMQIYHFHSFWLFLVLDFICTLRLHEYRVYCISNKIGLFYCLTGSVPDIMETLPLPIV